MGVLVEAGGGYRVKHVENGIKLIKINGHVNESMMTQRDSSTHKSKESTPISAQKSPITPSTVKYT